MEKYTEKELIIFGGVFRLAQSGADLSKITAKQIADAAGIGKATIYDYFSSKEEIIAKAFVYALQRQNKESLQRLSELCTYQEKMMYLYNEIIDTVENSLSFFNMVMSLGGPEKIYSYFRQTDSCGSMVETVEEVIATFRSISDFGIKTGAITAQDRDYITMTVTANVFSVGKFRTEGKMERDTICRNAYKMLIKALN